ncbi:hypothetical protein VP277E431_P0067 [Vibrio phage 277E43-1]|nr:hypothetical protein VP277E431_P0067 [Vibrio phage 277E43-1]
MVQVIRNWRFKLEADRLKNVSIIDQTLSQFI